MLADNILQTTALSWDNWQLDLKKCKVSSMVLQRHTVQTFCMMIGLFITWSQRYSIKFQAIFLLVGPSFVWLQNTCIVINFGTSFFFFFFDNQQLVVLRCGKVLSCSINHPGPVENVMGIFHYFLKPRKLTLCIQKSHLNAYYTPLDYCAAHSDKTVWANSEQRSWFYNYTVYNRIMTTHWLAGSDIYIFFGIY